MPGRCKAVNQCDYCARLAAVETAEVLAIDAMENSAPAVWSVLTTRTATLDVGAFKTARKRLVEAVRSTWPGAENATLIEMQTGLGTNSAGKRRPHWNDMWKGIPADDVDGLYDVASEVWCRYVDALPRGQFVGAIAEMGGLMRYLALHFQKESQQPPKGWRGHRFRTSRGYLAKPMAQARAEAREALQLRRELWKLEQQGIEGAEALTMAQRATYERGELGWSLVRLVDLPTSFDDDAQPIAFTQTAVPVR